MDYVVEILNDILDLTSKATEVKVDDTIKISNGGIIEDTISGKREVFKIERKIK